MLIEGLIGVKKALLVPVGASASYLFSFGANVSGQALSTGGLTTDELATEIKSVKIYIKNTGSQAFNAAVLQGSYDGSDWITLDATNITSKFGTLAGGSSGDITETGLNYPYLRMYVTVASSTTTATIIVVTIFS